MSTLRRALVASMLAAGSMSPSDRRGAEPMDAPSTQRGELQELADTVSDMLDENAIDATLSWRVKSPSSLAAKMRWKGLAYDEVLDRLGVRVIVDDAAACYAVRDLLVALYEPIPGSDRDYIEHPKPNGYQSLHMAVQTPLDTVEFQVRTRAMHATAEHGSAAHAQYKRATAA